MSVLGLVPQGRIAGGEAIFKGRDLLTMKPRQLREIRGGPIAMIFQDPMTSLNPVLTVGDQLVEAIRAHQHDVSAKAARDRVVELLTLVGVPRPEQRVDQYPHEFSGGMRQRAMIAMAIANLPSLLIADEPTTALDVTIQAQILDVLKAAQRETHAATILITHDLGVVAELADRVVVMYAGRVVELADVHTIFAAPRHPYTVGLMDSLPSIVDDEDWLRPIPGQPPSPDPPSARLPLPSALLPLTGARPMPDGESAAQEDRGQRTSRRVPLRRRARGALVEVRASSRGRRRMRRRS